MKNVSYFIILGFILTIFLFSIIKKTNTYDAFIDGVKESMKTGIWILPYILIMYVAVNVFISSNFLNDLFDFSNIPSKFVMQGVLKPISSHASFSLFISIINDYGIESKQTISSAILQGSRDTSFYIISLYLGYSGVKRTKHLYFVTLVSNIFASSSLDTTFLAFKIVSILIDISVLLTNITFRM